MASILITGGSRGIGAEVAKAAAASGYDAIGFTYANPARAGLAKQLVNTLTDNTGIHATSFVGDMTTPGYAENLFYEFSEWLEAIGRPTKIDTSVLNASGGLEQGKPPDYAHQINCLAQVAMAKASVGFMNPDTATTVFLTSHWAHHFRRKDITQVDAYIPVAQSKCEGGEALRALWASEGAKLGRLLVISAGIVDGTITPKLLRRAVPEADAVRLESQITATEVGNAVINLAAIPELTSGTTVELGPVI